MPSFVPTLTTTDRLFVIRVRELVIPLNTRIEQAHGSALVWVTRIFICVGIF
jgi:hypothetical protein